MPVVSSLPSFLIHLCRISSRPSVSRLVSRLDAVLSVLAYCRGAACRNPWPLLHANTRAKPTSLAEAMDPEFDDLYASFARFEFKKWVGIGISCIVPQDCATCDAECCHVFLLRNLCRCHTHYVRDNEMADAGIVAAAEAASPRGPHLIRLQPSKWYKKHVDLSEVDDPTRHQQCQQYYSDLQKNASNN